MGEGSYIRVLCYDILKQNKRHLVAERMILAMALVWPEVLGESIHSLTIHPEAVTVSGPPYSPFLATLQVMLMSREMSCEQTRQWLQRLCGWCDIPRDNNVLEWLARDLVRVLRVTNDATSDESPGMVIPKITIAGIRVCRSILRPGLHYQSFCDHSRNYWGNSEGFVRNI
jgi:hypothetical protein